SNETSPPLTYPLSLHDALPMSRVKLLTAYGRLLASKARVKRPKLKFNGDDMWNLSMLLGSQYVLPRAPSCAQGSSALFWYVAQKDRKSTRLNSSHVKISYAVFC